MPQCKEERRLQPYTKQISCMFKLLQEFNLSSKGSWSGHLIPEEGPSHETLNSSVYFYIAMLWYSLTGKWLMDCS